MARENPSSPTLHRPRRCTAPPLPIHLVGLQDVCAKIGHTQLHRLILLWRGIELAVAEEL